MPVAAKSGHGAADGSGVTTEAGLEITPLGTLPGDNLSWSRR